MKLYKIFYADGTEAVVKSFRRVRRLLGLSKKFQSKIAKNGVTWTPDGSTVVNYSRLRKPYIARLVK